MSDTLFDMTPYKSEAVSSYRPDWRDATGTDPAWDQSDLELYLGANSHNPDSDAPTKWQRGAEFNLTLPSGQIINVKFIPGLVGERRMHQFDFTGLVSATGFKSHFVLAVDAEGFPHPSDYAQVYAQYLVANCEEKQPQPKSKQRSRSIAQAERTQESTMPKDDSRQKCAMPKDETQEPNQTIVEVVEELSPEEEADRQRLELRVDRALYSAGCALRELRDRRLYRNTHKSWQEYCRKRFGYGRDSADLRILAAEVVENLEDKVPTNRRQILPTKLEQIRPLTKLEPDEQRCVWSEAVREAGGVPSGRLVKDAVLRHKGIVERLKQKNPPPELVAGDVVEIKATKHSPLRPFAQMWGVIERVCSFSYTVRISIARETQQCKAEEMTRVDDEYTADIKAVSQRIAALVQFELEPVEYAILEFLQRSKCFTPTQLQLLEWLEQKHLDA